jgi:putative DNA primase/helicase
MTQRQLAGRLRGFGVLSKSIRLPDGSTPKGYELSQFDEAFERYLHAHSAIPPFSSATAPQPNNDAGFSDFHKRNNDAVLRIEKNPKAAPALDCGGVADKKGVNGEREAIYAPEGNL